ncbi:tyrosyl-DNA phosphodiesterase 1 [Chamberlinius hualienensis]
MDHSGGESSSKKHQISDSDDDSDKTISEDELLAMMPGGKHESSKMDKSADDNERLDNRPSCQYGRECYRKNPQHLAEYKHPTQKRNQDETNEKAKKRRSLPSLEFGVYLTKVHGIPDIYNGSDKAIGIKDILSPKMGRLVSSVQFNYMFEISWLCEQYPPEFRQKPLLIVHGDQREAKSALERQVSAYSNITLCQAPLEIVFGTHHTKMMFLLYEEGFRVVIHTSNLIRQDWHQKTQGVWLSPVFPKLDSGPSILKGDSSTWFKRDLIEYLSTYPSQQLSTWCNHIKSHDFSSAKVFIIGSVPGRHIGPKKLMFGHLKLRKVLQDKGPSNAEVDKKWPVIGQFSSIGSLGPTSAQWLTKEWLSSLSATKTSNISKSDKLNLIFPSIDNVRKTLEGYPAGGSLPYSIKTAKKQPWLKDFFHVWKSKIHGRTCASPHIKTYLRTSGDYKNVAWMLITSANLSKAAWGALEKNDTQLMIRSYEMGVLFLPQMFGKQYLEGVTTSDDYLVPFDLPPTPYSGSDEPWMWDVPHTKAPDTHGMMWKPN